MRRIIGALLCLAGWHRLVSVGVFNAGDVVNDLDGSWVVIKGPKEVLICKRCKRVKMARPADREGGERC